MLPLLLQLWPSSALLLLLTLPLSPATTSRPDLSSYPMALTAVWWRCSSGQKTDTTAGEL
jgi:hypothetical protein